MGPSPFHWSVRSTRGAKNIGLQNLLTTRLKKYISDPVVSVSLQDIKGNVVYVIAGHQAR